MQVTRYKRTSGQSSEILLRTRHESAPALRKGRVHSQEDVLLFELFTRHWQQIDDGRPITVTTLLRICEGF